ncbi:MAG: hypothetical protein JWN17_2906 [Frankiales bacterium]|nr:hypothetical protein [Frankiales bacterium]
MTSGELKVNFGALGTAAADIRSRANALQSRLDRLDQDLAPLRADWTGDASASYQTAKAQWTAAITDMQQLLSDVGHAVETSNSEYQGADKANANRWS